MAERVPYVVVESFTGSVTATVVAAVNTRMAAIVAGSDFTTGSIPVNGLDNSNGVKPVSDIGIVLDSHDVQTVTMSLSYNQYQ